MFPIHLIIHTYILIILIIPIFYTIYIYIRWKNLLIVHMCRWIRKFLRENFNDTNDHETLFIRQRKELIKYPLHTSIHTRTNVSIHSYVINNIKFPFPHMSSSSSSNSVSYIHYNNNKLLRFLREKNYSRGHATSMRAQCPVRIFRKISPPKNVSHFFCLSYSRVSVVIITPLLYGVSHPLSFSHLVRTTTTVIMLDVVGTIDTNSFSQNINFTIFYSTRALPLFFVLFFLFQVRLWKISPSGCVCGWGNTRIDCGQVGFYRIGWKVCLKLL